MNINGLQKLTLLDFPEKIACIVFSGGCNFRCPFCHNASLVLGNDNNFIPECDFFDYLKKRIGIIEGVVISGGEPTLQADIESFISKIKKLGFLVKLDTNGYKPNVLKKLIDKNLLDYIAMDIKNCKEKYLETVGRDTIDLSSIDKSIEIILSSNVEYEFRTTVVKEFHESQDLVEIGKWIAGAKRYFLQSFNDSGDIIGDGFSNYNEKEMQNLLNLIKTFVPSAVLR